MSPVLQADGITVSASLGGQVVNVLQDLSFTLAPGRVLGLVGESGAGKSMIGRTIAQMLPPGFAVTAGRLAFAGQDLVGMAPGDRRSLLGRDLAFVPQEPLSALNPVLTIGQQFDEHLKRIAPLPRSERRAQALAAFAAVKLAHGAELLERYPHQLSGGMCQRVLIAMAFASRPKLVVADEPTTALDVTIQERVVSLLREMQERDGTAVLFVTHDLRLAAQICDDILVLYAGRPAEYGPARLFREPAHPYTRCLQLAAPAMTGKPRGLYALPERMPGLRAMGELSGCRFAPRCPHTIPACTAGEPPPLPVGPGHVAACIRPADTPTIVAPPAPLHTITAPGVPVLTLAGVTKRFDRRGGLLRRASSFTAVSDANLTLGDGEFLGIVGESGSGKSTLARLVIGLETPSAGRITMAGRDVTAGTTADAAHRRRFAQMVFQDPQSALNPRRRVGSLVTQALEIGPPLSNRERRTRAEAILAAVGLAPETADRYPAQLSGGQKQRVNIARALAAEPRLLVADEIVSGLDVSVQAQIMDLLLRLRRERGFSMLFIAHDLSVVRHLCDRVAVMYRGEIVETGPTEAVFANPAHDYTRTLLAAVPPDDPGERWGAVAAA
jgi:peptide/nickel transport system ATP-binding protein